MDCAGFQCSILKECKTEGEDMCELLGFDSATEQDITEYMKEFYTHSVRHPHGWGLAVMNEDGRNIVEKEPRPAYRSARLKERLQSPVTGRHIFGHIRYATVGNLDLLNSHPFTGTDSSGRQWTMIHNGTIFHYDKIKKYEKVQLGTTDSERIFLFLIDTINEHAARKGAPLDAAERFTLLDGIITEMSDRNKLNLMIFDGETMYVHSNCRKTMYFLQNPDATLFATRPVSEETSWQLLQQNTLLGYQQGKRIFTGTNHQHEYKFERHYALL